MLTRRNFILSSTAAIFAVGVSGTPVFAQDKAPKYKLLNRQNQSSNSEYRLIFLARKSDASENEIDFPGHAYLMTGEYDNVAKMCRFDRDQIFGFYPKSVGNKLESLFSYPLPGDVRSDVKLDLDAGLITHRLDVMVAQNGFDAAIGVASKYKKDGKPYKMGTSDCGNLVHDMLNAVHDATEGADDKLVVPDKKNYQLPQLFLMDVLRANGL